MQKDKIHSYHLRPLWIGLELQKKLFEAIKYGSSNGLFTKIIELGYNALILGGLENEVITEGEIKEHLKLLKPALNQENIKCIVKFQPFHSPEIKCDYLFWTSQCSIQPLENNRTFSENLQEELNITEKMIENRLPLIFYLPFNRRLRGWHNPHLLRDLCLRAGKRTILAFSAVAGHPAHDHLSPHPFLVQLRRQEECHSTPLLPVINTGGLFQGEGLWPTISFDLFDSFCMRDVRRQFAGFISLTNRLPAEQGFLSCNLWVVGQVQLKNEHPERLVEGWFLSKRPEIDYLKYSQLFKKIRNTIVDLSYLRNLSEDCSYIPEEKRLLIEQVMCALRVIHIHVSTIARDESLTLLCEQFTLFLCDAKKILLHLSNLHRVDISLSLEERNLKDSFWTKAVVSSPFSQREGLQISILDKPCYGPKGSLSYEIYHQTVQV